MKTPFTMFLAFAAPLASMAYTNSNAYPHNTFKPPAFVNPQQQHWQPQPVVQQQRPVKYDLGLGKHAPIGGYNKAPKGVVQDDESLQAVAYEMAQYCTEFQAVNALPNPSERLRAADQGAAAAAAAANHSKTSRSKPRIMPKRFHRDDFSIQNVSNNNQQDSTKEASALFVMTKTAASGNFDLNTAWVEMLLHEQELKLQAA